MEYSVKDILTFFKRFAFEKRMDLLEEKYDNFLELSVKQLVIQSSLNSLSETMR